MKNGGDVWRKSLVATAVATLVACGGGGGGSAGNGTVEPENAVITPDGGTSDGGSTGGAGNGVAEPERGAATPDAGASDGGTGDGAVEPERGAATPDTGASGGGADGSGDGAAEPESGAVAPDESASGEGGGSDAAASSTVTGRVADGYLRGATVCIDIDLSGRCDEGEPQSVSGAGGSYELDVPLEHAGKPLLAAVPPEAIDEDTGQPIGKELTLGTTGDRPGFISPITTLVLEEIRNNPALDTAAAERSVQGALGIFGEERPGLFDDYVAGSEDRDRSDEQREGFRYIHQTARVVAGMMHEITRDIEKAAVEEGLDVVGDNAQREALQRLVRREIKKGLPELAQAVAELIEAESTLDAEGSPTGPDADEKGGDMTGFDSDRVVRDLKAGEGFDTDLDDVAGLINAIRDESAPVKAPMQKLLADGIYWLGVACESDGDGFTDGDLVDAPDHDGETVVFDDEGVPRRLAEPDSTGEERFIEREADFDGSEEFFEEGYAHEAKPCEASYGLLRVSGEDNLVDVQEFYFDHAAGGWIEEVDAEDDADDSSLDLNLVDGEWVVVRDKGVSGVATFTADGGVRMRSGNGIVAFRAAARELDGSSIAAHLQSVDAGRQIESAVEPGELFPPDSDTHKLTLDESNAEIELFQWSYGHDESGLDRCAEWAGNCNVVYAGEDSFGPVTSLAALRADSIQGVALDDVVSNRRGGGRIDVRLDAAQADDGSLPVEGKVTWMLSEYVWDVEPDHGEECHEAFDREMDDLDSFGCHDEEPPFVDGLEDELVEEGDEGGEDFTDAGQFDEQTPLVSEAIAHGRWRLVESDGVEMIELKLPAAVARLVEEGMSTPLLVEKDGFVRRAIRYDESQEEMRTYSSGAFEALRAVTERLLTR